MRKLFLLSVGLLVASCTNQGPVSVGETSNSTVAVTADQWNAAIQSQKDWMLYSAALYYIGQPNSNCKAFVSMVVNVASGGVVTIPSTAKNQYSWNSGSGYVVNRNITDIANVGFMDIIQMYYRPGATYGWTAHTAIVVAKTSTQMTWLDANFKKNSDGVMVVATHDVTFSQFRNWSPSGAGFTAYHIK